MNTNKTDREVASAIVARFKGAAVEAVGAELNVSMNAARVSETRNFVESGRAFTVEIAGRLVTVVVHVEGA